MGSAKEARINTNPPGTGGATTPAIASDGDLVYVVWEDRRNGQADIYLRMSADGGRTWSASEVRLDTDAPGAAAALVDTGGELRIGRGDDYSADGEVLAGRIDGVRTWRVARSAAEIAGDLGRDYGPLPGLVASWDFDSDMVDRTGNAHDGAAVGVIGYGDPVGPSSAYATCAPTAYGAPSSLCTPKPTMFATSDAFGGAAFRMGCVDAPGTSAGAVLLATDALSVPLPFKGINLWVSPFGTAFVSVPAVSDARGFSQLPLTLPPASSPSAPAYLQYVWLDLVCGADKLVSSDAMRLLIH